MTAMMIEMLVITPSLAIGGVLVLGGIAVGRSMRPKPPPPITPLCTCQHGHGTHEADGGKCMGTIKQASNWSYVDGDAIAWKWVPCRCLHYDGPAPLSLSWPLS